MKSLMVVSQLNDPFYIDYDAEFAKYIIDKAKSGGLMEEGAHVTELDANLVMQLFSPLVLSQWLLVDQTREPCSSIVCPNGFLFAFKQTDDLLFIAVNGDGTESETFLHRKLQVFMMIMRFMFGPAGEEMCQSHLYSKKGKWDFLHQLMQSWSELVHSEQAFLVEAVERVHVNQMMNEKCMELLLKTVKQFQAARDQPTHHAMLLVNSKLLAMYSNRSAHELRPKDLLLAMLLSKTFYPRTDRLEDLFSKFYISTKSHREPSLTDDNSEAGEDEYHSAPNTPGGHRSRSPTSMHKSETVTNADSSDQDSQSGKSVENMSLLAMFKEKCPDVVFDKRQDQPEYNLSIKDELAADIDQTHTDRNNCPQMLNVGASVANTSDESLGLQASCIPISPQGSNATEGQENILEFISSSLQNKKNCKPTTNNEGVDETYQQSQNRSPEIDFSDNILHIVENVMVNKQRNDDNFVSPDASSGVQPSSSNEHYNVRSLSANENLIIESAPASNINPFSMDSSGRTRSFSTDQSTKSSNSTPFQLSYELEAPSRSSSVISNWSKTYPALLPQTGEAHFTGAKGKQTENVNNFTSGSKRINATMVSPKPGSVLHTGASFASKSTAESSSVTAETATSLSVFSSSSSGNGVYLPQTIFLETATCLYSPYNLYTVQISPGLTLILLSQAPRHTLADSLYQVIQTIQDVIYGRRSKLPRSRSIHVYETIDAQLGRIHNSLKKVKGKMKTLSSDIHVRWEKDDLKHRLLDFLERDPSHPISPELESPLMEIYKKLRELFSLLFLSPVSSTSQLWDSLTQIRDRIRVELLDYREYLNVKAQRNITMTSYIDDFPGLIHFIFIDRHFHQMTAPSLNISLKAGENMDATSYLKEKIWTMYQHMMDKLTEGYTTVIMRNGDFYFSYFLWFEDYMGNPLPVQESYKPSRKQPYPGILCGQFYKELLQSCFPHAIQGSIHCIEIFMMHLGTVHPTYIAAHCRKLAYKMWEMSGEIHHSVNLL